MAESDSITSSAELVHAALEAGNAGRLRELFETLDARDRAWVVDHLSGDDSERLFMLLGRHAAADVIGDLSEVQAVEVLESLPPPAAAEIVSGLESDHRADILSSLARSDADAILDLMDPVEAAEARSLLQYEPDTAGGIMITEYLEFPGDTRVRQVLDDLRENAPRYTDYDVQYAYIVGPGGALVGVLRMRDLLFSDPDQRVEAVMIGSPLSVAVGAKLAQLSGFFDDHGFIGAPVVDGAGRLIGVVRRFAVEEALREQASTVFRKLSGIVGGDELRSMPFQQRSVRRLSWLSANIVLNLISASMIALYQDTLAAVIALAVFLPMISDMSGCSGNQAVAVSLREMALGLVRPNELLRVLFKELAVGVVNGALLGLALGGIAALWKANLWLGLVVGTALAINTVLAVCLGGLIPLTLKRFKLDPALASSPLLTTVTDMCGFFLVLSIAKALLPHLV